MRLEIVSINRGGIKEEQRGATDLNIQNKTSEVLC